MWLCEASMWAGPNGEREMSKGSHGDKGYSILVKLKMEEIMGKKPTLVDGPSGPSVEDKGKSGEDARRLAVEDLYENEGVVAYSPKVHAKLFELGWVLINDESGGVTSVMAKSRDAIVKAEEAVMQYLSKGPVNLIYEGAGAGFQMTMEDVDSAADFNQAISNAEARSGSGVQTSSFDLGIWMSSKIAKIKFDRP